MTLELIKINDHIVKLWEYGDGAYALSDGGGWLPGLFDSKKTAIASYILSHEELAELCERINHKDREDRLITMQDLEK